MGHYIGLRFTAKLKPEFVPVVARLLDVGQSTTRAWHIIACETLGTDFLLAWAAYDRAAQIPFGAVIDMPEDWKDRNTLNEDIWSVCCSTKNEKTIKYFLEEVLLRMSLEIPFCEVCVADNHPEIPSDGVPKTYVIDPAMRALAAALLELDQLRASGDFDG